MSNPQNQNIMPGCGSLNNCRKPPKKLFILGENLQQKMFHFQGSEKLIGNVLIEDESGNCQSSCRAKCDQNQEYRHVLYGFLEEDNGSLEKVRLELTEPIGDLINFSNSSSGFNRSLTARIEIDGKSLEEYLPVVEIDLLNENSSPEAAKVIAIVENNLTGRPQKVEVALVPTSTDKQIHGKILEIQSATSRPPTTHETPKQSNYNLNTTFNYEQRLNTSKPLDLLSTPRRNPKSAKKVFKDIARMVHALSAMGTAAVEAEASR